MKLRVSKIGFENGVHIRHRNYQFVTNEVVEAGRFLARSVRSGFAIAFIFASDEPISCLQAVKNCNEGEQDEAVGGR